MSDRQVTMLSLNPESFPPLDTVPAEERNAWKAVAGSLESILLAESATGGTWNTVHAALERQLDKMQEDASLDDAVLYDVIQKLRKYAEAYNGLFMGRDLEEGKTARMTDDADMYPLYGQRE